MIEGEPQGQIVFRSSDELPSLPRKRRGKHRGRGQISSVTIKDVNGALNDYLNPKMPEIYKDPPRDRLRVPADKEIEDILPEEIVQKLKNLATD